MSRKEKNTREQAVNNLYRIYLGLLNATFIFLILLFGYLVLQKEIHSFLNRKVYTPEEIAIFNKKADARQRERMDEKNWDRVENGIHVRTGLHADKDLQVIIGTCTACHSAKLITQNKASREGWHSMIKWMQETQGLGDLGTSEPIVLDYLAKYYAPKETGRRKSLEIAEIEWYILDLDEEKGLQ